LIQEIKLQIQGERPRISKRKFLLVYSLFILLCLYNLITRFQEYSGEVIEGFLMLSLAYMWVLQTEEQRKQSLLSVVIVVCCLRFISLCERANEWDIRLVLEIDSNLMQFAPFPILFVIENKINR